MRCRLLLGGAPPLLGRAACPALRSLPARCPPLPPLLLSSWSCRRPLFTPGEGALPSHRASCSPRRTQLRSDARTTSGAPACRPQDPAAAGAARPPAGCLALVSGRMQAARGCIWQQGFKLSPCTRRASRQALPQHARPPPPDTLAMLPCRTACQALSLGLAAAAILQAG